MPHPFPNRCASERSPDRFDRGEIDLLLSPDYILSKIHPSRHLFNSGWAIVAAADNDCYGPAPTLEQFRSARYVVREMRGNRFDFGSLDIAVHTPTYAMMISVIEGSRSEEHTSELQSLMR